MNRLRSLLRRSSRERGSAVFVWIVVLFPIFFSIFGAAIDVAVAATTRTTLQTSLDAAVQSTISQASNTNTDLAAPALTPSQARNSFVYYFSQNLDSAKLPWLECSGSSGDGCGFDVTNFQVTVNNKTHQVTALNVSVYETSKPLFLNAFNILEQWKYNLTSTATQTSTFVTPPPTR